MSKAHSLVTATMMLAVFLCLGNAEVQAGNCSFCICGSSSDCTESDDCLSTTGCSITPFTVPCDGFYQFEAKVICQDESDRCNDCLACANIYRSDGAYVANEHNTGCDGGSCSHRGTVHLKANQSYNLYVCLAVCNPNQSCEACGESCKACGCIWKNISTPCSPL